MEHNSYYILVYTWFLISQDAVTLTVGSVLV